MYYSLVVHVLPVPLRIINGTSIFERINRENRNSCQMDQNNFRERTSGENNIIPFLLDETLKRYSVSSLRTSFQNVMKHHDVI